VDDHIVLIDGVPFKMIDGEIQTFPCWFNSQLSGGKMNWKTSWWKRVKNYLIWKPRRFIYRLLDLPDEIEESIGSLNWAVNQNAGRLEIIEGFLVLDGEYEILELAKAAVGKTTMSANELFQKYWTIVKVKRISLSWHIKPLSAVCHFRTSPKNKREKPYFGRF